MKRKWSIRPCQGRWCWEASKLIWPSESLRRYRMDWEAPATTKVVVTYGVKLKRVVERLFLCSNKNPLSPTHTSYAAVPMQETSSVKSELENSGLRDGWHRSGQDEATQWRQEGKVKFCLLKHETLQHPFPNQLPECGNQPYTLLPTLPPPR